VPAFDNATAMATIEKELGAPPSEIYSELTTDPIAAASLGQVYKGVVRTTGELVAVKVQRPYVLETVTVDLYVIRKLGMALRDVPAVRPAAPLLNFKDPLKPHKYSARLLSSVRPRRNPPSQSSPLGPLPLCAGVRCEMGWGALRDFK
jgi:hypothetical protein